MKQIIILAVSLLTLTNMLHASEFYIPSDEEDAALDLKLTQMKGEALPTAEVLKERLMKLNLHDFLVDDVAQKCAGLQIISGPMDYFTINEKVQESVKSARQKGACDALVAKL